MFEVIVVPLDGSSAAEQIIPDIEELATKFASRVILLHVVPVLAQLIRETATDFAPDLGLDVAHRRQEAEIERATRYLEERRGELEAHGVRASVQVVEGSPARGILDLAQDSGASLVAMTTHGRGGMTRMFYGSVAEDVLRNSTIPVLVQRSRL